MNQCKKDVERHQHRCIMRSATVNKWKWKETLDIATSEHTATVGISYNNEREGGVLWIREQCGLMFTRC